MAIADQSGESALAGSDRVLLVMLALLSGIAAAVLGYVVGWMTGASGSPVGHVTIPVVAGIIAALGAHEVLQGQLKSRAAILKAMAVPALVGLFSLFVYSGIRWGATTRPSYNRIYDLIGERWDHSDPEIVAEVHAFRVRARFAGMLPTDYAQFMLDSVAPVINDDKPEKLERLRAALAAMEAAFPKPESNVKAEPAEPSEPADEPTTAE